MELNILEKRRDMAKNSTLLNKKKEKKVKSMWRELLETVVSAGIIAFIIITFIGQVTVVKGASMEDTLFNRERLICNKISYRFSEPQHGDIVIFKPPIDQNHNYIKRLIAVEGDKVKIVDGTVYLNGEKLEESYIIHHSFETMPEITIPENSFFVLGDNRNNSSDSRFWGFVPRKNLIGKASVVFWPINKIRMP